MLKTIIQIFSGALILLLGIALVSVFMDYQKQKSLPEGWAIIREPGEVSAILVRGDNIWAGGRDGVTIIHRDTLKVLPTPAALTKLRYVRAMQIDANGTIWIAHSTGVAKSIFGEWRLIPSAELGLDGAVYSLLSTSSGDLWIGGEGGLVTKKTDGFAPVPLPESTVITKVTTIFQDNRKTLWVGSDSHLTGGLLSYSEETGWKIYLVGQHLLHASINDIIQDQTGKLWVATGFAGRGAVSLFEKGNWATLKHGEDPVNRKIRSIYEDWAGRIWLGFEYDGISVLDNYRRQDIRFSDGLVGEEGKVVRQDGLGTYWIGTTEGLSVIRSDAWNRD